MKKTTKPRARNNFKRTVGHDVIVSLKEAVAWAGGGNVRVGVTTVNVTAVDVRAVRRRLGLSQSEFAPFKSQIFCG